MAKASLQAGGGPAENAADPKKAQAILTILMAAYIFICLGYAAAIPQWQAGDEPFHFLYAEKILQQGELPVREKNYQAVHPPFYYAFNALAALPVRGKSFNFHLYYMRFVSAAIGALCLLVLYRLGRRVGGEEVALMAVALAGSIPMLAVNFSTVTNDCFAILFAWIACYAFCHFSERIQSPGAVAASALAAGLAVAAKSNNALVLPLYACFYLAFARDRRPLAIGRDALIFLAVFVPVGLSWHYYAWTQYGGLVFGNPVSEAKPYAFWLPRNFLEWLRVSFGTFWMWMNYLRNRFPHRPEFAYFLFFAAASAVLVAGMFRQLFDRSGEGGPATRKLSWLFLIGFFLAICEIWGYNRVYFVAQSRYAFPALAGLLVLWAMGLQKLFGGRALPAALAFFGAVQVLNLVFLYFYIRLMPQVFFIGPDML